NSQMSKFQPPHSHESHNSDSLSNPPNFNHNLEYYDLQILTCYVFRCTTRKLKQTEIWAAEFKN
ncbi:29664_t:CDS:1, partial [Gigaspora margarita]